MRVASRLGVVLVAGVACGGSATPGDTDTPGDAETDDAPTTDVPDDSEAPVDSEVEPVSAHPAPRWTELLGPWCPPGRCETAWYDPTAGGPRRAIVNTVVAGRGLFGPEDARVVVLVDLRRDDDGDGEHERRGLILAYDPTTGALVDPPDLPDDFDAAGLVTAGDATTSLAGVVDLDGDGQSELLWSGPSPVWRWDRAASRFVPDEDVVAALPPTVRAGLTVTAVDVSDLDDDGRLDLQVATPPDLVDEGRWGAVVTLSPRGDGTWRALDLHDHLDAPRAWPVGVAGFTALRDGLGGRRLEIVPADGWGSCWLESGRTTDGFPRLLACDIDDGPGGIDLGLNRETPMGAAIGPDLDRDGRADVLVTTGRRELTWLDVRTTWSDRRFDDLGPIAGLRVPPPCDADAPVVRDDDGEGWTCPLAPSHSLDSLPWGIVATDLDRDGWFDVVAVSGEDQDAFELCPTLGVRCVSRVPIGVWYGTGAPVVEGGPTRFEAVPLERLDADVPPVGGWQGLAAIDLDGDADLDLLLSSTGVGFPAVFREDTPTGRRGFCLVPRGTVSNPLGVGSEVEVTTPDGVTRRLVLASGGQPNVYVSPEACFGVGQAETADVTWRWPSGFVQRVDDVPTAPDGAPGRHLITEPRWLEVLDEDGAPRPDGTAARGRALVVRACRHDDAPTRLDEVPPRATDAGAWTARATSSTTRVTVDAPTPGPAGCVDVRVTATSAGETRLVLDAGAGPLPHRPRLTWR